MAAHFVQSTVSPGRLFKAIPETPPNTPLLCVKTEQPLASESTRAQDGDSMEVNHPSLQYSVSPRTSVTGDHEQENVCALRKPLRRRYSTSQPPNFLGLAIIVTLCNCPLGILAIMFACLSTGDYSKGDVEGARSKGQVSKWLSIIGFVSIVLIAVMVAMYFLVIERNIVRSKEDLLNG